MLYPHENRRQSAHSSFAASRRPNPIALSSSTKSLEWFEYLYALSLGPCGWSWCGTYECLCRIPTVRTGHALVGMYVSVRSERAPSHRRNMWVFISWCLTSIARCFTRGFSKTGLNQKMRFKSKAALPLTKRHGK